MLFKWMYFQLIIQVSLLDLFLLVNRYQEFAGLHVTSTYKIIPKGNIIHLSISTVTYYQIFCVVQCSWREFNISRNLGYITNRQDPSTNDQRKWKVSRLMLISEDRWGHLNKTDTTVCYPAKLLQSSLINSELPR